MTTINHELYKALLTAGVPEDQATAAAIATPHAGDIVTKTDLRAALADLRNDILYWMVGGFMVQTALLLSVLTLMK